MSVVNNTSSARAATETPTCRLELLREPSLALAEQTALMGARMTENGLEPDPAFFSCCSGKGRVITADDSVAVCSLDDRLGRLRDLHTAFSRVWGARRFEDAPLMTGRERARAIETLDAFARRSDPTGFVWQAARDDAPSAVWDLAMIAVWRFGIRAHVITVEKTPLPEQIPPWANRGDRLGILFVEGLDKPWQAGQIEALDGALSRAWGGEFPVFIEFGKQASASNTPTGPSAKSQFARRMARAKARPWREALPAWTLSRLESRCRGMESLSK